MHVFDNHYFLLICLLKSLLYVWQVAVSPSAENKVENKLKFQLKLSAYTVA